MNLIKKLFPKKVSRTLGFGDSITIHTNDHLNIVHRAARICVGAGPLEDYDKMTKHVEKVIGSGHESVLEHSNVIMYIELPNKYIEDLLEASTVMKYLNFKTVKQDGFIGVLIGGSIRGYKHIFKNIKNMNNEFIKYIKEELYISTDSVYYADLIEAGIFDPTQFKFQPYATTKLGEDNVLDVDALIEFEEEKHCNFSILNCDDIEEIYKRVQPFGFTIDDLLDMCTISIRFDMVSRAISQQMTRHRDAISQESQRYVDYSDVKFVDPTQFKNKYDMQHKYSIEVMGVQYNLTTEEIAEMMMHVYPQLREQGLDKEDARGFQVFNAATKLIMTFTFRYFIHFLSVRVDKAAQSEVRILALNLEAAFISRTSHVLGENIYKYLLPKYVVAEADYDYSSIDESIGDAEEVVEEVKEDAGEEIKNN